MTRASAGRLLSALIAGLGLLGIGVLGAGVVTTMQDNVVAGAAAAVTHRAAPPDGPHVLVALPEQSLPGPSPSTAPSPAPTGEHPITGAPKPSVQSGLPGGPQPPGTIRLAHGGTAKLVHSTVGPDGTLAIPDGLREASWWGSAFDGSTGATVVAGHVNWDGAVGPFNELWRATPGDRVTVLDDSGHTYVYRVSQVITLTKDVLPQRAPQLFAQDGPHRLVLVTCGGAWIGGSIGYASNQVVIATPA